MDSITIIGIIAAAGSVAAVALVLGYLQKRRTKMPSVSLQSSLLVHEPQPDEMPYDVFISYSHADQHWVRNWLLPRLEAAGLRVCIDCRDFEIGKSILDNIEWAVDNSRHTLLVLTPAWVASEWGRF
jgi:hypothetical protein